MKQILFATFAIIILAVAAFAQGKDEQEIMKIHNGLFAAYTRGDVDAFAAPLASYYTYSNPEGKVQTKAEVIKEMRGDIDKPTWKKISDTSENVKIHILGSAAYLTATWTSVGQGLGAGTEPHTDEGQYTAIYEKIDGKWMIVRDVFTEQRHDKKIMEEGVLKASNAYDEAMLKRDKVAYARLLADDYTHTTEDGALISREEDLAHFDKMTITSAETRDKKIRIIGNAAAVETGIYHAVGTSIGKPFDETSRYTTTWIWRMGRWQIIADHNSIVSKK